MNRVLVACLVGSLALPACKKPGAPTPDKARGQRISYAHGNEVVVRDGVANGPEKIRIKNAADPCLSPDGRSLGMTRSSADGTRTLAMVTLETKHETLLAIPGAKQVYGCMFAPKGEWVVFNELKDSKWQVGAVHPDGKEPRVLTAALEQARGWFLAGVNRKTGRVLAQDMRDLVELDWDGKVTWRAKLADLLGDYEVSSGCRFFVDEHGTGLIADVEADEALPGMDGPTGILVSIDLATKKRERLTPPRLSVSQPWLDPSGDSLYFTGCGGKAAGKGGAPQCAGYRLLLASHEPELWVKGGACLSTSNAAP